MEFLKGFCTFNDLILNGQKEVSTIGELSPYGKTFTRNIQQFSADPATFSDLALHVLSYRNGNNTIISNAVKNEIVAELYPILDWINTNSRNGTITTDYVQFNTLINSVFGTSSLSIEATAMYDDTLAVGAVVVPRFIEVVNTDPTLDYTLKVWFVDRFFQTEYDEYELVVIPPLTPIDQLTQDYNTVKPLLDAKTIQDYNTAIFQSQDGLPCSIIKSTSLTWHQLDDNSITIPNTIWTTLIYGPRGDNIEIINDNLIDYILNNSSHNQDDWQIIYPDLFIKDEYTIVPIWDNIAIGEHLVLSEIFSPQVRVSTTPAKLLKYFPNYDDTHVLENMVYTPTLWQSLLYASSGGVRNEVKPTVLSELYPDIILAQSGSADYDRMSEKTRTYISNVTNMIIVANEYVNDGSYTLPSEMGTILRAGLTYISMSFDDATYLVLARMSYT